MRTKFLPFSRPQVGEEEIQAVAECLRSGWLTSGLKVKEFEADFARYVGCKHAVAVNSCTAALHLALEALGIVPGDEVITSPMTFAATAAVIEHLGARPVFADCEPSTLNLDPGQVERRITARTRAILPVHFAGQPCRMDGLMPLARSHGLFVVEDAAHALPAEIRGRRIGTIGDITCFSFYPTKTITTGEGGMAVTDREDYAERMRLMHLHGIHRDPWKRYSEEGAWIYEVLEAGYKYNLTDIGAAIGIEQLKRCDGFHARRREIAARYTEALSGLPALRVPSVSDPQGHAWHLYVIQLATELLTIDRDEFIEKLKEMRVGASVHFIPLHLQPYYRSKYGYVPSDFPNVQAAWMRIVSLPIYPGMSDTDVDDVIAAVHSVVEEYAR